MNDPTEMKAKNKKRYSIYKEKEFKLSMNKCKIFICIVISKELRMV